MNIYNWKFKFKGEDRTVCFNLSNKAVSINYVKYNLKLKSLEVQYTDIDGNFCIEEMYEGPKGSLEYYAYLGCKKEILRV